MFEYGLNSDGNEQILKMSKTGKYINFVIESQNGRNYVALITLDQLKKVCKGFSTTKTLNDLLMILHNNIEAGNIALTEDEQGAFIELKFSIKLASGNFPPFSVILDLYNPNSLKEKGDDAPKNNQPEAKKQPANQKKEEGNKYSSQTVAVKKSSEKKSNDSSTKNQEKEVNKNDTKGNQSKYSTLSVPDKPVIIPEQNYNLNNTYQFSTYSQNNNFIDYTPSITQNQFDFNNTYSYNQSNFDLNNLYNQGSTYNYTTDNTYNTYTTDNTYNTYTTDNNYNNYTTDNTYNNYTTDNTYTNYNNYSDFNNNTFTNYTNYSDFNNNTYTNYNQDNALYQTGVYTQNSYDTNQIYSQNDYQNYQYQNNNYYTTSTSSYPQTFNQFDQAFAEVIPLNPIEEFLSKEQKDEKDKKEDKEKSNKKEEKKEPEDQKKKDREEKKDKEEKQEKIEKEKKEEGQKQENKEKQEKEENEEEEEEEEYEEIEENEEIEDEEENEEKKEERNEEKKEERNEEKKEDETEEKKEAESEDKKEDESEDKKEDETEEKKDEETEEKNEEANEENNEEENQREENKEQAEEPDENEENEQMQNDIEALFRTEEGLIIFRNGILKGIIQKYAEIDDIVTKIQDKLLKGAKFILLYKATTHGDKASVFHERCDKCPMSLVLIETNKGARFGGFTTKSWEGRCEKKIDNDAFVFNINTNKMFDVILNEPAIGCYPKFGPVFFGCQIRIYNDFFTKEGTTCFKGLNYKTTEDFELNNGEQTYIVKDIEVYEIEAIDV